MSHSTVSKLSITRTIARLIVHAFLTLKKATSTLFEFSVEQLLPVVKSSSFFCRSNISVVFMFKYIVQVDMLSRTIFAYEYLGLG